MVTMQSALSNFRCKSSTPVHIIHTDLPENSWTKLFKTTSESMDSYKQLPNVFASGIGESFYKQLLPSNSVHLGFSSNAFHYLSRVPTRSSCPCIIYPEAGNQLMSDLALNLSHRINELANKGILIFSAPAKTPDGNYPFNDLIFKPLKNCVVKGIVTECEFNNMVWPTYPLDESEILQVLKNFEGRVEVKSVEVRKSVCPFYVELCNGGDIHEYRAKLCNMLGVVLKNALFRVLSGSDEEKEHVFEEVKLEIRENITSDEFFLYFYIVIIQKI